MSRLNIVAVLLFMAGLLWVFTLGNEKRHALQGKVLAWFAPLHKAEEKLRENREIAEASLTDPAELLARTRLLEAELARERVEAETVEELRSENDELRDMLRFVKRSYSELIPARVVRRPASNWWSALIIDKGMKNGVATDVPVRSEVGLVGKTAEIEDETAKVLLLTDEQCWVAAKVEGIGHPGMIRGQRGNTPGGSLLRMQFLDKNVPIAPGRKVYTRGVDGVYPANILIGTVLEFIPGDIDAEAIVQPAVDFTSVKNVFVIVKEPVAVAEPVGAAGAPTQGGAP